MVTRLPWLSRLAYIHEHATAKWCAAKTFWVELHVDVSGLLNYFDSNCQGKSRTEPSILYRTVLDEYMYRYTPNLNCT